MKSERRRACSRALQKTSTALAVAAVAAVALATSSARADGTTPAACSDAYTRAQELRNQHKLVQARDALRVCAQVTCKDFIVKDCTTWLDQVDASLPSVVPVATDEGGNDVMNVRVSMDGAPLVERLDGGSIPVNPGAHTFTFETAAGVRVDKQVVVSEGEKNKRVVVQLSKGPGAAPTPPMPNGPSAAPLTSAPLTPSASSASAGADQSSSVPWKPIAIGVGAAGAVGLAIGAGFGIDASSKKSAAGCDSNSYCPSAQAASTLRAAKSSADLSTAFFVAGGLLAAGGVTLWVLAPSSPVQASASAGDHLFAIDVKGTW